MSRRGWTPSAITVLFVCLIGMLGFIIGDFVLAPMGYGFWFNGKYLGYAFFPELAVCVFLFFFCLLFVHEKDLRFLGLLGSLVIGLLLLSELLVNGVIML